MKKSLSQVFILSAALLLASCGGPGKETPASTETPAASQTSTPAGSTTGSDSTPAGSTTGSDSTPAESSMPEVSVPADMVYTPGAADIVKESNKIYLKFTGTLTGVTGEAAKFAFGLQHKASSQIGYVDPDDGQWLVGSETPASADYKYAPTIGTDGAFEVKIEITNVQFIKGSYTMFVGPRTGYAAIAVGQANYGNGNAEINGTKLIFRGDQNLLVAEELPPVHLTQELIEIDETNNKAYIKVGGELTITEAAFQALDIKVSFEKQVGGWSKTAKTGNDVVKVVEGTKGYIKVDITDLSEGGYQVKIGFDGQSEPNTTMECESYDMRETPYHLGSKGFAPFFLAGDNTKENLYGCCGLFVQHYHNWERAAAQITDSELWKLTCGDATHVGYELDLNTTNTQSLVTTGSDAYKMNGKKESIFDIDGIETGEYEVYFKCHVSAGNSTANGTVGLSTGDQLSTNGKNGGDAVPGRYSMIAGGQDLVYTDTGDRNFYNTGIGDTNMEWTRIPVIKSLMIKDDSATLKLTHTGAGYSLYIESVRLVKVGEYVKPYTAITLTEGVMRIEAEDAHVLANNKSGTITNEGEGDDFSGDKIVSGLGYQAGNQWMGTAAVVGSIDFHVKNDEAKTFKVKAHLKSNRTAEGKAAEVYVDGEKLGDLNAANTWTDAITAGTKFEAGKHIVSIRGVDGSTTDVDYIELVEQSIPAATLKVNYTLPLNSQLTDTVLEAVEGKVPTLPTPIRPGAYKFVGWYTAAEGGTKVEAGDDLAADMDLFAHWEEYTWAEGTKTGSVTAETSGTDAAYKLAFADASDNGSWPADRIGVSSSGDKCVWDCTGLPAGTYDIQISARGANNSNISWWSSATSARYFWEAGEGDGVVKANPVNTNFETTGLVKGSSTYCLTSVVSRIEIAAGTTRFAMGYNGSGNRLYGLEYVRLIKVA